MSMTTRDLSCSPFPSPVCRDQAVNDLMEAVAMEEAALSHILRAEGDKLQRLLALCDEGGSLSPHMLLEANRSVKSLINSVIRLEVMLQSKLDAIGCDLPPES